MCRGRRPPGKSRAPVRGKIGRISGQGFKILAFRTRDGTANRHREAIRSRPAVVEPALARVSAILGAFVAPPEPVLRSLSTRNSVRGFGRAPERERHQAPAFSRRWRQPQFLQTPAQGAPVQTEQPGSLTLVASYRFQNLSNVLPLHLFECPDLSRRGSRCRRHRAAGAGSSST